MKQKREFFRRGVDAFRRLRHWLAVRGRPWGARRQRQLRLCENLALGERRFLSVVECGQQRFLVGGSAQAVALLAELAEDASAGGKGSEEVPTYKFVDGELTKDVRCS